MVWAVAHSPQLTSSPSQGYIVTPSPQRRLSDDPQSHIPDFVTEVVNMTTALSDCSYC